MPGMGEMSIIFPPIDPYTLSMELTTCPAARYANVAWCLITVAPSAWPVISVEFAPRLHPSSVLPLTVPIVICSSSIWIVSPADICAASVTLNVVSPMISSASVVDGPESIAIVGNFCTEPYTIGNSLPTSPGSISGNCDAVAIIPTVPSSLLVPSSMSNRTV